MIRPEFFTIGSKFHRSAYEVVTLLKAAGADIDAVDADEAEQIVASRCGKPAPKTNDTIATFKLIKE